MSDSTEDNPSASPGEEEGSRRKSVTFRLPVSSRSWDEGISGSYQLEEDEEEAIDEESQMV